MTTPGRAFDNAIQSHSYVAISTQTSAATATILNFTKFIM